jgi:hypothetical protein
MGSYHVNGGSRPVSRQSHRNLWRRGEVKRKKQFRIRDEIAVLDTATSKPVSYLSTKLPGQQYGGSDTEYLALSSDEKTLFSANAVASGQFDLATASLGASDRAVRGPCATASDRRHLWVAELFRLAARTRNRHACGAWRPATTNIEHHSRPRSPAYVDWSRNRFARGLWRHADDVHSFVPSFC